MPATARRAIIAGAGPGGLAAAVALERAGFGVTVCERAGSLAGAGSGLTLWPNATRALDALDLLPAVTEMSRPLTHIVMRSESGRVIFSDELALVSGGERFVSVGITRAELIGLLARHLSGPVLFNASVSRVCARDAGVVAELADGRELEGSVVVAADGLRSAIRAQLVGPDPLVYSGYVVWRGIAPLELEEAVGTTWMGKGRQFGLFPLSGRRAYWFASQRADRDASEVGRRRAEVEAAFADWPDPIPEVVRATDEDAIRRTAVYDRAPLRRWCFGRTALLGDAAHPAEPTLGQGACQAIEDGLILAACLAGTADIAAGLRQYESRRLKRANGFVLEARRIGRLGLWENRYACWLRETLMGAVPPAVRRKQLARMFSFAV